ncbi:hypothetical protein BD626DRAFT_625885 [Schizophyllum amplum]|uniref:Zn(2)-C6 fungal-type domain-containing protein n=1 Tax=Schizophyllum amplum TaxID=97359 RepID=A0A550CRL2_9AGAR|nr:hypothetical protein BD626DRAFT_625885 [Auriculariopsis ampla]
MEAFEKSPVEDSPADDSATKRKKRACDYCKAKRVICHPQTDGKPCPRCIEKGRDCTTTVLPRKTRGTGAKALAKRALQAASNQEKYGNSKDSASPLHSNTVALRTESRTDISSPLISSLQAIPARLVQDAIRIFSLMLPSACPILSLEVYQSHIETCGWDIHLLPPQERVLSFCLLATASLVSVDPAYVGHDAAGHRFSDAHLRWESVTTASMGAPETRELGRRRKTMCAQLYGEAVRQAHQDGITSLASRENASSCFLLSFLDGVYKPTSDVPWATAFVWQLRTLSERAPLDPIIERNEVSERDITVLQMRGSMLLMAYYSIKNGKSLPFSTFDELLICGPEPMSLEDAFEQRTRLPQDMYIFQLVKAITARCIRIIRDAVETLVAVPLRHCPPADDLAVLRLLSAAEHHHAHLTRFRHFARDLVAGPGLRYCLHTNALAHCALVLALGRALGTRAGVSGVRAGGKDGGGGNTSYISGGRSLAAQLAARARALAVRAVVDMTKDMHIVIAPHWLGLNQPSGFEAWVGVLIESGTEEDGYPEDGIYRVSAEERVETLVRLRDLIQFSSFIGLERLDAIPAIDAELAKLRSRVQGPGMSMDGLPSVCSSRETAGTASAPFEASWDMPGWIPPQESIYTEGLHDMTVNISHWEQWLYTDVHALAQRDTLMGTQMEGFGI